MSDVKLKPCPFCGGGATVGQSFSPSNWGGWIAGCDNDCCGPEPYASGGRDDGSVEAKQRAISIWNTRAEDELASLRAQNERMREALRPFADEFAGRETHYPEYPIGGSKLQNKHLRAARAALSET